MITLQDVVKAAYEGSPFWKQRLDGAGISPARVESVEDLSVLPVLRKDMLPGIQGNSKPFGEMITRKSSELARIFLSPGPIYDPQAQDGDYWRFSEALREAGFRQGDIVQNTFSYHLSPAGFMFDQALRNLEITVIPAGVGNTELQVQVMKECGITGYVGTPSFLITLLEKAQEAGWQPDRDLSLEKALFTAERLRPEWKEQFAQMGISPFETYGTADAGCIAYQTREGHGLKVTDTAIVQICDPATGEPIEDADRIGEIVITLLDPVYPLIRFGTGDLSQWVTGHVGERILGVLGRAGDGVKVRGMFVHLQQLEAVFNPYQELSYFQAVVTQDSHRDQLTIYLEPAHEGKQVYQGNESNRISYVADQLLHRLKEVIRVTPQIAWVQPGTIDRQQPQLMDKRKW